MDHVVAVNMAEGGSLFANNHIDNMTVDTRSTIMEDDDDAVTDTTMNNIQDGNDAIYENEPKHFNKKYHIIFKPSISPISNRLRRKK